MQKNHLRLKAACYMCNISMSVVASVSPLLFLTFRQLYGLSYSQLGLLVLLNYCTQLGVDLLFSFFSHRFNIPRTVRLTPMLTTVGLLLFSLLPQLLPRYAFGGIVLGTVVFSAAAGLNEVLISPVIASIPAKDPDKEMSKLHSVYAWGLVAVIVLATLLLQLLDTASWYWMVLCFVPVPLIAAALFAGSDVPAMQPEQGGKTGADLIRNSGFWGCLLAIFSGGAAECTMSQWSSGYLEQAFGLSKVWGDIFGVAMFGLFLGLGRTLHAKKGGAIGPVLFWGNLGAAVCYLAAAVSDLPLVGLVACALTGLCVSMLWPGNLIAAAGRFPAGGVFLYAMMAAAGDLGASVGPQLVGVVTDLVSAAPAAAALAQSLALTPEQLALKAGLLTGLLFPLLGIPVYWRQLKKARSTQ